MPNPPSQTLERSLELMKTGGIVRTPIDSGMGGLYRPFGVGTGDGRIASLETLFDYFVNQVYDPDLALAQDPDFEEKCNQQPDVHAAMVIRQNTVAQFPWSIAASDVPGIDPATAKGIAEYVDEVLRRLDMETIYEQMQVAVLMGGVGHEWVWHREANGVEYPVEVWNMKKQRFVFDRLGNMAILTRNAPVWGEYVGPNPDVLAMPLRKLDNGMWVVQANSVYMPHGKFTYHRYMPEGGTFQRTANEGYLYYGRGEASKLYVMVNYSGFGLHYWMKFLEKYGIPPMTLYGPDNQGPIAKNIAASLRGESVTFIPHPVGEEKNFWFEVEDRQFPSQAFDAFSSFLKDYIPAKIRIILLGDESAQAQPEGGGSYSSHVSRKESGTQVIFARDAKRISQTLSRQLIPHIVLSRFYNCPPEYFPKHVMQPSEERDVKSDMEVAEMVSKLVPIKESEVYERSGYSKPAPDDKTVFNGGQPADNPFDMMSGGATGGIPPHAGASGGGNGAEGQQGSGKPSRPPGMGEQAGGGAVGQSGDKPRVPEEI